MTTEHLNHGLLRGVHEVSLLANSSEPASVSQRAFDEARVGSAEHTSLPAASQIARELRLPWRKVVSLAHEPTGRQSHLLGLNEREQSPEGWLTESRVRFALRLVAGRLNVETLTMGAYDAERDALLVADRRDWMHGRRLRLPSAEAIREAADGWDEALRLAGLAVGVRPSREIRQTILSRLDVMDRFYEHYGEQPTQKALLAFARGNQIPMSAEDKRLWSETVAGWKQRRRERGLPEPRVAQRKGGRGVKAPDYSRDVGAAHPGEQPHRGKWADLGECAAWVARYHASLQRRERSTQTGYRAWARQNPGAPSPSAFAQHGGWEAVRGEAQEQNEAQRTRGRAARPTHALAGGA